MVKRAAQRKLDTSAHFVTAQVHMEFSLFPAGTKMNDLMSNGYTNMRISRYTTLRVCFVADKARKDRVKILFDSLLWQANKRACGLGHLLGLRPGTSGVAPGRGHRCKSGHSW